jgi:hypothetical protein
MPADDVECPTFDEARVRLGIRIGHCAIIMVSAYLYQAVFKAAFARGSRGEC